MLESEELNIKLSSTNVCQRISVLLAFGDGIMQMFSEIPGQMAIFFFWLNRRGQHFEAFMLSLRCLKEGRILVEPLQVLETSNI